MKLSEAIRLGTTICPPIYGPVFKRNWRGCVTGACRIGATALAAGYKPKRIGRWDEAIGVFNFIRQQWPWTETLLVTSRKQAKHGNNHLLYCGMASYIAYCHEVWHMTADEIAKNVEAFEAAYETSMSPVVSQPIPPEEVLSCQSK